MKSRYFTLAAVLDLRAAAKDRAQDELGAAVRERDQAAATCEQEDRKLARMADQLREARFTAFSRYQGWNALCRQQERCAAARAALAEAEDRVLARRAKLVSASIDHELVLRLKQKWLEARARAEAHRVERQLEEFVSARRNFKMFLP
jgi:flagellar export protein FliJ